MDYERIHKVQMGVISPSKLRMTLLGAQNIKRKEGESSSRASPSKLQDMKNSKQRLLTEDLDEEGQKHFISLSQVMSKRENDSLGTVDTLRHREEGGNENASTCSFEFHGGEKITQNAVIGHFYRHIPSKWNDAEKWIVNRQGMQAILLKKGPVHSQCNRQVNSSFSRIAPESTITEQNPCVIQQEDKSKFSFICQGVHSTAVPSNDTSCHKESASESWSSEITDVPTRQSVSMRDVGTEMTPMQSQGASRIGTPKENLTPSRSPMSSDPSSPRARTAAVDMMHSMTGYVHKDVGKKEMPETDLQLKTRQEIATLGLQLGKLNIVSWARKEAEKTSESPKSIDEEEQLRKEFEARAAAWEEAEQSKHMVRYKREQIKIQAWESRQRAKYEARMRKLEIRAAKMRTRAEVVMADKLKRTEQMAEQKRANAEAKKNRQAARTSQQAQLICETGRVPSQFPIPCCSLFLKELQN